jgi:hypothetical protein
MAKVDVSSVPDRVYAILRERILAGDLEPESRLHQEGISAELRRLRKAVTPSRRARVSRSVRARTIIDFGA